MGRWIWVLVFFAQASVGFCEDAETGDWIPQWTLYAVAVFIGAIVSFFLNRMARSNRKVILAGSARPGEVIYKQDIQNTIDHGLASVVSSKTQRSQIVHNLSSVVSEKVNQKIAEVTTELQNKYETALAEKEKEQEVVQLKYKNVVQEKNQSEAILQSLAEGLVVVNSKGDVVMMNPAAEKILGVQKDKKIGHPLQEDMKEEGVISMVNETKAKGEKVVEFSSAQQETRKIIRSSSAIVENENGQTVGMVSVLTDITKQRDLDRLKNQFVSNVTHELRTPIVATQKALDVIIDKAAGPITDDQARFLDIARRNMDRLNRLINDILDFSKLEAGKMTLEFASVGPGQVVEEACTALSMWASSKEILLERKVAADLPEVRMDPHRVIQVINNLVSNALKFTPKGGRVTVEVKRSSSGQEVEFSVEDTGIGIAKEDLRKVFERFLQVGERRQTDVSGTGLGLSIAKEIVELHGGRIWVESEKGKWTRFLFILPIAK